MSLVLAEVRDEARYPATSLLPRSLSPSSSSSVHQLSRDASLVSATIVTLVAMAPVSDRIYFPSLEECLSGERVIL